MNGRLLLATLALGLAISPALALDIKYFDRATNKEIEILKANVEEGPDGLTIKGGQYKPPARGTFPIKVSPLDIREYQLRDDDIKPIDFLTFRAPLAKVEIADKKAKEADRLKDYKDSLPLFQALIPRLAPGSKTKRHVEYRFALTLHKLASADETFREQATTVLNKYSEDHTNAWQITPVLQILAQLQEDQNDLAAVQKTYEKLASVPGLAEDVKTDSLMKAAGILIKTEKYAVAKGKLLELQGRLAEASPMKNKVGVYLAQCQILSGSAAEAQQAEKQLRGLLSGAEDKTLKALAHNTLGDYYRAQKREEDAFWEYLRVDTLYGDDRFEHARAMYHLIELFREVKKDADRADSYLEELKKPRYVGLEWQKKVLKK